VLCEKPIATTLAEADRMLAACREAGVRFMIAHSRRFAPRYVHLHRQVAAGAVGEVRLVKEQERRPWPHHGPDWNPGDRHMPDRETVLALNIGIHECDLLRWFMASDAESVYAEHQPPHGEYGYLAFTVRFKNGGLGISSVSFDQPVGYPVFHEMEVYGTKGVARVRDHELQTLQTFSQANGMQYPIARESLLFSGSAYRDEIEGVVDACLTGGPLPLAAEEGRAALELVQAVIQSYQTGQEVKLPLEVK
jgi:predicted dehydrogenase